MASTSEIKNGLCIKHNNKLMQIIEFQHVKPGKGPAFVRTKMKGIEDGRVLDHTFPSGHKIEVVRIENRSYQYLYKEGDGYHFMHSQNFEQIFCTIIFHAEEELPLLVEQPQFLQAEVTYTEPGVKGDTATNTMKPATIDTGAEVKVPLFINTGDMIKVDIQKSIYVERVKL
jgi:elongation factor P